MFFMCFADTEWERSTKISIFPFREIINLLASLRCRLSLVILILNDDALLANHCGKAFMCKGLIFLFGSFFSAFRREQWLWLIKTLLCGKSNISDQELLVEEGQTYRTEYIKAVKPLKYTCGWKFFILTCQLHGIPISLLRIKVFCERPPHTLSRLWYLLSGWHNGTL